MSTDSYTAGGKTPMHLRFRGFLPVVVDVETGGFNAKTDALLEVAVSIIAMDELGNLVPEPVISTCLLYTSPSPRDLSTSRMPSSA